MFNYFQDRRFKLCLILYLTISSQSCFRVGLPERFYSYELEQSQNKFLTYPKMFISIPSRSDTYGINVNESSYNLGHQFVLGLFPLTSLYLEHGVGSFYLESLIQYFHSQGISPLIISNKLAQSLDCPNLQIQGQLDLTVYDLIFSRLIDFSGDAAVKDYRGGVTPVEINSLEFYSQAQYPLLAHLLQQSTSEALIASDLSKLIANCRNYNSIANKNVLLLAFPDSRGLSSEILSRFAKAYGDHSGVFSASMLSRVAQRGAELALEPIGEPIAMASNFGDFKGLEDFTKIEMLLVDIKLDDNLTLIVDYRVSSNKRIKSYRCKASEDIDYSRDGALIIALEKSAQSSLSALFLKKPKVCEAK